MRSTSQESRGRSPRPEYTGSSTENLNAPQGPFEHEVDTGAEPPLRSPMRARYPPSLGGGQQSNAEGEAEVGEVPRRYRRKSGSKHAKTKDGVRPEMSSMPEEPDLPSPKTGRCRRHRHPQTVQEHGYGYVSHHGSGDSTVREPHVDSNWDNKHSVASNLMRQAFGFGRI